MRWLVPLVVLCGVGCFSPVAGDDAGLDASILDAGPDPLEGLDGGGDAGGVDAGSRDAGVDGGRDAGADAGLDAGVDAGVDAGPPVELVTVQAERELRGVWVSTVLNLDWPSSSALSADAGRAQLVTLVDSMADAGLNALFFQVRPESDALYRSTLEPWSRFLTGTQGRDPGWDPLDEVLTLAHARGMEVHAWVNPYRALQSTGVTAAPTHVSRTLSAHAITYNGQVVMNPGVPAVRAHVKAVVRDLLDHYDVDGLHFDDYFYPYPDANQTPFPDSATYAGYQADGGTLSRADWRRENVNTLVREVMGIVQDDHPQVRFGISPFGIWRTGQPVPGLDAYNAISCDAPTWIANGWVDYLAPQLYWKVGSAQDYQTLTSWWTGKAAGRHIFPGHALHQLTSTTPSGNWPVSEIEDQVNLTRAFRSGGARGDIHFRAEFLFDNAKGVHSLFKNTLYAKPALPPVIPRAGATHAPAVPFTSLVGGTALWASTPQPQATRFFALYRQLSAGQWELRQVKGGPQASFIVTSGTWAVSAIGRGGAESQGVKVVVP